MAEATQEQLFRMRLTDLVVTSIGGIEDLDAIKGKDGVSPIVRLQRNDATSCVELSITDANGLQTVQIKDGTQGPKGEKGETGTGERGPRGFTAKFAVEQIPTGEKISYNYNEELNPPLSAEFILTNGQNGAPGSKGDDGNDGKSAYQLAVDGGYVGTQEQWIASLKGDKGDKGDPGEDATGGLDISAVMEYFGKVSLLKPANDDGRALQLSAVFYDDEACSTSAFQIDTATAAGKACTYAFVGGNNSDIDHMHAAGETNVDAAWLRLADWPTRFEDGLGPEFDNYPILLDIRQFVNDDQIMSKLQAKKHLYAKYAWYWYDDNDVAHYSDEYSLVFPSTTEVGASSNSIRSASSSASASGTNVIDSLDYEFDFGGDDISAALLQPDTPNVLSVGLEPGMNFCFKDYSEDKHYIVKFQPKAGSANITRDSIALWSQNVDGTITPLEIVGWTGITATTAASSFVSSRVYVGEFFFGIYANRLSATV